MGRVLFVVAHVLTDLTEILFLPILAKGALIVDLIKINPVLLQVNECGEISCRISEVISVHGESDQKISSYPIIPNDFFEDMESWKGRVKRIHLEEAYAEVEKAAEALSLAVSLFYLSSIILMIYKLCIWCFTTLLDS